jgi:hypothetical protein
MQYIRTKAIVLQERLMRCLLQKAITSLDSARDTIRLHNRLLSILLSNKRVYQLTNSIIHGIGQLVALIQRHQRAHQLVNIVEKTLRTVLT